MSTDHHRPGDLGPSRERGAAHRRRRGTSGLTDPAALLEPLQALEGLSHRQGVLDWAWEQGGRTEAFVRGGLVS